MKPKFPRVEALPPYVFSVLQDMKAKARSQGQDIVDLGMGNPNFATPRPIISKLQEASELSHNHRYSVSRGLPKLRLALAEWYKRHYNVSLDSDRETIVTIGAKEGIAHLMLAVLAPGEAVWVPDPCYPIHSYAVTIAGGELIRLPSLSGDALLAEMERSWPTLPKKPKVLVLCFPNNPTTATVDETFFPRVVAFARERNLLVIHDFAYADLVFDGYRAPSILQVPGAKDIAVELYSLSKGYNMPGWRVGFMSGNADLVAALARMKSYLDYGIFQPIQIASIIALNDGDGWVKENVAQYKERRDVLIRSLDEAGWEVASPRATMFVWASIPERFRPLGSLEFCKRLLLEGRMVASPGIGFGPAGEGYVRFALVENCDRIRQAVRGIKKVLQKG